MPARNHRLFKWKAGVSSHLQRQEPQNKVENLEASANQTDARRPKYRHAMESNG
jgi:hypothetical protein